MSESDKMTTTEREMVARDRAGDKRAFDELVNRNKDKMFSLTYRMTGVRETALDMVQETFFTAYKELGKFRGEAAFSSWLYRIAANRVMNHIRRGRLLSFLSLSREETPEPSYIPDDAAASGELHREMYQAVAALPPMQKLIFNMRFYEELPFREIASILGRSESTVKTGYQKAVEKLRQRLKDFR